jgi:hypothetical protein
MTAARASNVFQIHGPTEESRSVIPLLYRHEMAGCPDNRNECFLGVLAAISVEGITPEVLTYKGFRASSQGGLRRPEIAYDSAALNQLSYAANCNNMFNHTRSAAKHKPRTLNLAPLCVEGASELLAQPQS